MRVTQGCFSFLPDLTDEQITAQVQYCLEKGWAVNIEFTDDPHPRNTYWDMWGLPMFDLRDAAGIMMELNECRKVYSDRYIRMSAFDSSHGWSRGFRSSSTVRRRSRASISNDKQPAAVTSVTPRGPTPSIVPRASVMVASEHASGPADSERSGAGGAGRPAPGIQRGRYRRGARSA